MCIVGLTKLCGSTALWSPERETKNICFSSTAREAFVLIKTAPILLEAFYTVWDPARGSARGFVYPGSLKVDCYSSLSLSLCLLFKQKWLAERFCQLAGKPDLLNSSIGVHRVCSSQEQHPWFTDWAWPLSSSLRVVEAIYIPVWGLLLFVALQAQYLFQLTLLFILSNVRPPYLGLT